MYCASPDWILYVVAFIANKSFPYFPSIKLIYLDICSDIDKFTTIMIVLGMNLPHRYGDSAEMPIFSKGLDARNQHAPLNPITS